MNPEARDGMEVEEDDQDVQSQIALELSQRQEEEDSATSKKARGILISDEESMQVDVRQPITGEEEAVKAIGNRAEATMDMGQGATTETSQAQKIMNLFRSGLDELRLARLSREEVYQIEDMFMDMRRELYEAERRGRP